MAKSVEALIFPENLKYTDEHIWVYKQDDNVIVGVSDYAQDQLGEVMYIELPSENSHYNTGEEFGEIESVKSVNKLFMPISGTIISVNNNLINIPTLINKDCYGNGWIIKMSPDNDDIDKLLSSNNYIDIIK